jgi:hypothetical protein
VTVDAAELLGALDYAGGARGQRHLPVSLAFDDGRVAVATEIIDSIGLVEPSVPASVGGTPRRTVASSWHRPSCWIRLYGSLPLWAGRGLPFGGPPLVILLP